MTQSEQVETTAVSFSRLLAEQFIVAMEGRDVAKITDLLSEDIVLVHPMTFSGRVKPEFMTEGKLATLGYIQTVFTNFAQIRFANPVITVSADGGRVFIEAQGDFVTTHGNLPYNNVYVFRADIMDSKIVFINEYANPVTASAALGIPLGNPAHP